MKSEMDAKGIARRDPMVQGAIESLQDADDAIRAGRDATVELIAAQALIETLIDKHAKAGR